MASPLFELKNITLRSNGQTILNNVNLEINEGEFILISGVSGSGKSSLLRLFNRLDSPSSGEIYFKGKQLSTIQILELRLQVGMLFQKAAIFPGTVKDNLMPLASEKEKNQTKDKMLHLLREMNLSQTLLDEDMSVLSGGEQQRISLARVLLNQPEVLLLDEPSSALDPENTRLIFENLEYLNQNKGLSIVLVSHNEAAQNLKGIRKLIMENGNLRPTNEVMDEHF
ncbi:MAG TPA: ATP-binding cassette domain-containing protein [Candidatus Marinimicrobia bacterium]|nr:ATP-binding cassette domain-containing protein [Candidatus Neomarinimicrobiota bacterium]